MNNNLLAENDLEKAAGGAIIKTTEVTLDRDGNVVAKKTNYGIYKDDPKDPEGIGKFVGPILGEASDEIARKWARRFGVSDEIVKKNVKTKLID